MSCRRRLYWTAGVVGKLILCLWFPWRAPMCRYNYYCHRELFQSTLLAFKDVCTCGKCRFFFFFFSRLIKHPRAAQLSHVAAVRDATETHRSFCRSFGTNRKPRFVAATIAIQRVPSWRNAPTSPAEFDTRGDKRLRTTTRRRKKKNRTRPLIRSRMVRRKRALNTRVLYVHA